MLPDSNMYTVLLLFTYAKTDYVEERTYFSKK